MLACTPSLRLRESTEAVCSLTYRCSQVAWQGMAISEAVLPHLPTQEGHEWRQRHPNRAANYPRS